MSDISIYGYTDIGGRKENEDSGDIRIYGKNLVAVIADGLGGQGEGKTASETAVSRLLACGSKEGFPGTKEVSRAFCSANEAILKKQLNQFHMKTTAVYLCICKNQAIWGHVGDSRLYHFQDGELCHYTLDHESLPDGSGAGGDRAQGYSGTSAAEPAFAGAGMRGGRGRST